MVGAVTGLRDISHIEQKPLACRVLIVDDEPLIRWSLAETLMGLGLEVVEAGSGAGAAEALAHPGDPIDVVLLDYRLPDSNDLTLLSRLKQLAPASHVILMTAYGTPEVVRGAIELGAFDVMHKPFEMDDLASLVLRAHQSQPGSFRLRVKPPTD